jgi:hypothetical protein
VRARGWVRRLLAAVVVITGVTAPQLPAVVAVAGGPPLTWGSPHRVAPYHDGPESLSCVSGSFCVAVDRAGNAMVERQATWSRPHRVARRTLHDVSCAGPKLCLATGDDKVYRYDGSSWRQLHYPGQDLDYVQFQAVSCPASTFCLLAGGGSGGHGVVLRYDGDRLSAPRQIDGRPLATISCLRSGFCMAGDDRGRVVIRRAGAWSAPLLVLHHRAGSPQEVVSLSCGSRTFCVAADITASAWNGRRWTIEQVVDSSPGGYVSAVSCVDDRTCLGATNAGESRYSQGNWSTPAPASGPDSTASSILGLSCTDAGTCQAIDLLGVAYAGDESGLSETAWVDRETHLTAIDCPSASMCVAVDDTGHVVTYNGHRWSARHYLDARPLTSVSCPTTTSCTIADGAARVLRWNGSWWSRPAKIEPGFDALQLSCPSSTFCAAIGNTTALVEHGTTWSAPVTISPDHALLSLSCSSSVLCMATDDGGFVHRYQHGKWAAPVKVDATDGPFGGLMGVSCASRLFCAAVDDRTDGRGSAVTWNGTRWSAPQDIDGYGLTAIDCPTARFCLAADGGSAHYWLGDRWSRTYGMELDPPGMASYVLDVSCASRTFCVYLDGNSAVGIGRD